MPDAPPTSTSGETNVLKKLNLGKKVGPLPIGAWVILAGLAIGGYLYWKNSGNPDAEIAAEDQQAADMEDVGTDAGVGEGPGYTYFPPPTPLPSDDTTIRNNQQWGRMAIERTIRETNIPNNQITQAVTLYLAGKPLSEQLRGVLQQVFEIAGAPPKPLPIIKQGQGNGGNGGGGGGSGGGGGHGGGGGGGGGHNPPHTPFPTPGGGTWHRIQRGQTLQGIARRYYNNPADRWRDIFNANRKGKNRPGPRDGFMDNPNDLPPGRWLWIPGPTPKG